MKNPGALTSPNEALVMAYPEARFSLLRIEKNLSYGAIQVVDVISQKPYILIDKALNNSKKEGCFFCCSIIDRNDYIMTTGGGILIDGRLPGGRDVLTVVIDQLKVLKNFIVLIHKITRCIRRINGFCLRNRALSGMPLMRIIEVLCLTLTLDIGDAGRCRYISRRPEYANTFYFFL